MYQTYLFLLILPLLATSLQLHPTCPSKTIQSKCLQERLLSTLLKPYPDTYGNPLDNLHNDNTVHPQFEAIVNKTANFMKKTQNTTLSRSKSFSKKSQKGFGAILKNIPQTISQYLSAFINKVASLPKAVPETIGKAGNRIKDFIVVDIPGSVGKLKEKILGYFYGLPKDFSEVERVIKGIPYTVAYNLKVMGEKMKRMLSLKTVNGTTVLREKINNLPNLISKGTNKLREKFRILQNSLSNAYKNFKERVKKAIQSLWDLPANVIKMLLNVISSWVGKVIGFGVGVLGLYAFYCEWKRRRAIEPVGLPPSSVLGQQLSERQGN